MPLPGTGRKGIPQEGTLGRAWKDDLELSRQRTREGRADPGCSLSSRRYESRSGSRSGQSVSGRSGRR